MDLGIGYLNDLWRYRMNDSTWTWMGGSNTIDQPGVYGELRNASTEHIPRARADGVRLYDSLTEEFWIFGGATYPHGESA